MKKTPRPTPDPDLTKVPLLHFRTAWGLALWPADYLAMLRVESTGRLEGMSADGDVAWRPGPVQNIAAPLTEVAPGVWINPRHMRRVDGHLVAPDGTRIPFCGQLPRSPRKPRQPQVPGTDLYPSDILYFRAGSRRQGHWQTVDGRSVPARYTLAEAHDVMPELVRAAFLLINPRHIRGILESVRGLKNRPFVPNRMILSTGDLVPLPHETAVKVLARLRIPSLNYQDTIVPAHRGLYRMAIREFLEDLRRTPADRLKALFATDERALIANVIWQAFLTRCDGRGTTHRGFWYNPLQPILSRAGFLTPTWTHRRQLETTDPYLYFRVTLEMMVQDHNLFTYEQLGFEDPTPELRRIGTHHPDVILLAEKTSIDDILWQLCDTYGCSGHIQRGDAKVIVTEYFAKALRERTTGPIIVIAWVDYDPWGWTAVDAFIAQLLAYGISTAAVHFLVTPARFTPTELSELAVPLKTKGHSNAARVQSFMDRTNGINGKPLGILMDYLRPYERAASAFEEETGLTPI